MPSSRQARMTRSAISPRFAIRTFLNIPGAAAGSAFGLLERVPALVARARDPLDPKRELRGTRRVVHRALVRDDALLEPLHQGLVERLHPVLHRAFLDEVRNVERRLHVPDLVA